MPLTAEEKADVLEERSKALGQVDNHCPFGCSMGDLDEYGYCGHLVGFTNDGKVIETVQTRKDKEGNPGNKYVSGKVKLLVEKGDTLVNPEFVQILDSGVKHLAKRWASSRVYRGKNLPRKPLTDEEKKARILEHQKAIEDLEDQDPDEGTFDDEAGLEP
jgi:hypothetical protein